MGKTNFSDQAILEYLKGSGGNTKSSFGSLSGQYKDIVNQPTGADAVADAFSNAGNGEARGPAQRESNALQRGIGGGIKAYANDQRSAKLQGLEQQTAALLEQNAILEQQQADANVNKEKIKQVYTQGAPILMQLGKATVAKDIPAQDKLAKSFLDIYKRVTGDETVGDYSHTLDGSIYYMNNDTGLVEGRNPIHTAYQAGLNLVEYFGQDTPEVEGWYSPGAAKNYKNTEEERALKLQGDRANIGASQAYSNAQNAQADKLRGEMNAPAPKYHEKVLQTIATDNTKWVNELKDKHERANEEMLAYQEIAKIIKKENEIGGRAGLSLLAKTQRALNNAGTQSEKNQALLEMYKQPLMRGIKDIFAGATSDRDVENFIIGLPSLDKNAEASIKIAKERAAKIASRIENDNLTADVLESDFGFGEPYNSKAVQTKVAERKKALQGQNKDNSSNQNIKNSSDKWFQE